MIIIHYNKLLLCVLVAALWPQMAWAALTISEIAWMGTEVSANDEWIELHNSGGDLSVEGWQLTDGKDLKINLTGTVSANSYVVLERTDDTSAPGTAFLLYTGALSNTGGTLQLYDADGALVDQVAGGEDWENIGGDNTTKETAQISTGGWVTAAATPGRALDSSEVVVNDVEQKQDVEDEEQVDTTTITEPNSEKVTTLYIVPRELSVDITFTTRAYVNQAVSFSAEGSGLSDAILQSLHYDWNFGDATTGKGKAPQHIYQYPGNYVVTLVASYGDYEAEYRETVTVLPTNISVTKLNSGDIQIHNDAKYEVDVSGYRVGGVPGVILPERTIILPRGTITIPSDRFSKETLAVAYDNAGRLVYGRESGPQESAVAVAASAGAPPKKVVENESTEFSFKSGSPSVSEAGSQAKQVVPVAQAASASNNSTTTKETVPTAWPWYAMIGLLSLATVGVYTRYL